MTTRPFDHPTLRPPLSFPITIDDACAAQERIRPFVAPTPTFSYPLLDDWVGHGIHVAVKHENFSPTGSFKVRNGLSFMTALAPEQRQRGVVAATRGNHGLGLAYAARALGGRATICVPVGNNPEKNAGVRALGARLIEEGRDYDESLATADRIVRDEGAILAHSTNNAHIIAGAATLSLELLEQAPDLDALVIAVGGGSQAVGAMTVARARRPSLEVYAVQAAGAPALHDSWQARAPLQTDHATTFADGLATRSTYELTFPALLEGLAGFTVATEGEIAEALRVLLRITHTMVEGAGATGLAGLRRLAPRLAGRRVGIVVSGGNIDQATLLRVLHGQIV